MSFAVGLKLSAWSSLSETESFCVMGGLFNGVELSILKPKKFALPMVRLPSVAVPIEILSFIFMVLFPLPPLYVPDISKLLISTVSSPSPSSKFSKFAKLTLSILPSFDPERMR